MYEEEFEKFSRTGGFFERSGGCISVGIVATIGVLCVSGFLFAISDAGLFGDEVVYIGSVAAIIIGIYAIYAYKTVGKRRYEKGNGFIAKHPGAVKMYGVNKEGSITFWMDRRYIGTHDLFCDKNGRGIALLPEKPYNLGVRWGDDFDLYIIYYKDVILHAGNMYFAYFDNVTKVFSIEEVSSSGRRKLSLTGKMRFIQQLDGG